MKTTVLSLLLCAAAMAVAADSPSPGADDDLSALNGRSGANLKNAVAATFRPQRLYEGSMAAFLYSSMPDGSPARSVYCPFDGQWHGHDEIGNIEGIVAARMACTEWWDEEQRRHHTYKDTIAGDLHNFMAATMDVVNERYDWGVAVPYDIRYDGGLWQTGWVSIAGGDANCWMPPAELRGDIARLWFYMATIYPTRLWLGGALLNFSDDPWPGISAFSLPYLLAWHREDPPSAMELCKDSRVRELQGNGNPFVAHPELVEYIWGDRQGELFEPDPDTSPLRSAYSLSRDTRINLHCPGLVADDARWSCDGTPVDDDHILLRTLSAGIHCLTFTTPTRRGCVNITVTQ